ncbi:class I SAM-dependent methyltransferase [Nocardia sp. CDC160]|uniref:class I SAM-dependent methyltransferase n=1 Tax=Nocardia sp. CDC160 TaxID=3112166 RepID=UPI002DBB270C|nr:class I SAM-dependent methyltransferase [Nocardia sp. CDC160]MEC3918613.1 class I SAM-dependent methyltransferase [Nocardia sp. CDC160]
MSESDFRASTERFDFDAVYRGDGAFGGRPPWDIGEPQPAIVDLEARGGITGLVLDCGCGTGDNALFLAERGHPVHGIDLAPTAIAIARSHAAERGLSASFQTADALELSGYHEQFDTVVDSALAHLFGPAELTRYAAALHHACRPGAMVYVLAIAREALTYLQARPDALAEQLTQRFTGGELDLDEIVPSLTPEALHHGFRAGWSPISITETTLRARLPFHPDPIDLPALLGQFHHRSR